MKNVEYAEKLENEVKKEILDNTTSTVEKEFVEKIFNQYLTIEVKEDINNMVDIDLSSHYPNKADGVTTKLSNVKLKLKEAILLAIETAINFEIPQNTADFIKLSLNILLKVYMLSRIPIGNDECQILIYLHNKNAYKVPVSEETIYQEIDNGTLKISKQAYHQAIDNLIKIASVFLVMDNIYLKERIKLNY